MNKQHNPYTGLGPSQVYREALAKGDFRIQQCNGCGKHQFYPRALCKYCGGTDLQWVSVSGQGTVYSTSVVRQKPEDGPDYNVALVDLAEGPRMLTRVVEIAPEAIRIGMRVNGFFGEIDGESAYLFRPATGGDD